MEITGSITLFKIAGANVAIQRKKKLERMFFLNMEEKKNFFKIIIFSRFYENHGRRIRDPTNKKVWPERQYIVPNNI